MPDLIAKKIENLVAIILLFKKLIGNDNVLLN